MGRGKQTGKQILKRERARKKKEEEKFRKMSESSMKMNKQIGLAWVNIRAALRNAGHEFEIDDPVGKTVCKKCRKSVNEILEASSGIGYLLSCCPRCHGSGEFKIGGGYDVDCKLCEGKRIVDKKLFCVVCNGTGFIDGASCQNCLWTGREGYKR